MPPTPLYGLNATKRDVTKPADKIDAVDHSGKLRTPYDEYSAVAEIIANAEEILLMKIPKGARLHEAIFHSNDATSATGTLTVGWKASADGVEVADPNGIFDTINVKAAAVCEKMTDDKDHVGIMKKFEAEVQVYAVMTEATDAALTALAKYRLGLQYSIE